MKINEVNRQLDEGFLDNLISKIQDIAGDDGATGIIRALQGNNAALNKFADAIANSVTPQMTRRVGNSLNAIQAGTVPMPIGEIYKQAANVGSQIASKDGIEVSPQLITQTIRSNKQDIFKIVLNGDPGDDATVKLIFDAVAGGTGTASIGVPFAEAIKTVSLIVAGTIIFIQTQQQDAETEFDDAAVEQFNTVGAEIDKLLFLDNSPALLSLKPNERLRDNLETLVVTLIGNIKNKFLTPAADQLTAAAANPPEIIQPALVTRLLGSHTAGLDAAVVNAVVAALMPMITAQFKEWLALAATEQTPGRPKSYELYRAWADSTLSALDNLNIGTQPTPGKPPAPVGTPPDAEEEIQSLADSHDAGETALRNALATTPNLTAAQMKDVYDKARAAYDTAHPTP